MHRVHANRQIHKQIDGIWQWNAKRRGEAVATAVIEELWGVLVLLGAQPGMGVEGTRRGKPTRRFLAGDYWAYYQRVSGGIRVVCLKHHTRNQARDWDATLRQEGAD